MDVPVHSFCGPDAPVTYSLVYNGAYLIPDTLICLLLAALVGKRLLKAIKGN